MVLVPKGKDKIFGMVTDAILLKCKKFKPTLIYISV